jgi:hypothetical protein
MAAIRIMQGDSYPVFVALNMKDTGDVITPDLVSDVEISVGESLRKTYSAGETLYDSKEREWYFIPTQEETLAMEPGGYEVQARVKFPNGSYSPVKGIKVGTIIILDANSSEVI